MTEKQLLELLERHGPAIRDAVLAGIREVRDEALVSQIEEMIRLGNVDGALRALGYNPAVFNRYYMAMMQAFQAGGMLVMTGLPKYAIGADGMKTPFRFNIRDPRVEKWLAEQSSRLITDIGEDVRQSVRETMQEGAALGRNPRRVALDIVGRHNPRTGHREGGTVGLGTRERAWARSARTRLIQLDSRYFDLELRDKRFDSVVRAAIEQNRPLPVATVDKLVDRYRARALLHRGETIGRTEALAALNKAEYEAILQALEQSDRSKDAVKKVWDSAGDSRVRHSHRMLDGVSVGMDEPFISPVTGDRMMHPGDTSMGAGGRDVIACRCKVRYDIDFLHEYR